MKVVEYPISGGTVLLDQKDVQAVSGLRWGKVKGKNTFYARAHIYRNGKRTSINMHNFLLNAGASPVDHADRNGLNNTRTNLRISTHFANLQNCYRAKKNTKFKGVQLHYVAKTKGTKLWRVSIGNDYVGIFKDEIQAAKAYDAAALKRFGPTTFLNSREFGL